MSFHAMIFNSTFLSRIEIFLSNFMAVQMSMTQHHIHFQKKKPAKAKSGKRWSITEHYFALLSLEEYV